ncbi:MAG: signal peptidase I [Anaeromyxobacter sp.]
MDPVLTTPAVPTRPGPTVFQPRPLVAGLLGLLCNGLGHVYAGRLLAGVLVHLAWLALQGGFVAALRIGPRPTAAAATVLLVWWIGQAILAARLARATKPDARRWASRPWALVAVYLASVLATTVVQVPFQRWMPRTFHAPAGSMNPTVQNGDFIVMIPGQPVRRGDVVIHGPAAGAARRDPLIKRVVAIGGDTIALRAGGLILNDVPVERTPSAGPCSYWNRGTDGSWEEVACIDAVERLDGRAYHTLCVPDEPCGEDAGPVQVPEGHVYVVGDNRPRSADSRYYGPIPELRVIGRAAWIYFSWGPSGPRWERIGRIIE